MKVTIFPSKATGTVVAPPSKSIAHRALICGALTEKSVIENVALSEDIEATLSCLIKMGAKADCCDGTVTIGGLDPFTVPDDLVLDCGESGSTLRFLIPLCLLSGKTVTLRGHGRLMERPLSVYEDLCAQHGLYFAKSATSVTVKGPLKGGHYRIPGDVSSQFITGLMFALSQLKEGSTIEIIGNYESESYVDITQAVFSHFGIAISRDHRTYFISENRRFSNTNYYVEGDCSNASFLDAFNLFGGCVKVLGLSRETPQGDWVYRQIFAKLLQGKSCFSLKDCPDLGPVLFAVAAALGGATFTDSARLRFKESDRVTAMAEELAKFSIKTIIEENSVQILPGHLTAPSEELWGHNDHRIVMALSLLCSLTGGVICGAEAVAKSYPNFFEDIQSLGIQMTLIIFLWFNESLGDCNEYGIQA